MKRIGKNNRTDDDHKADNNRADGSFNPVFVVGETQRENKPHGGCAGAAEIFGRGPESFGLQRDTNQFHQVTRRPDRQCDHDDAESWGGGKMAVAVGVDRQKRGDDQRPNDHISGV